MDEFNNNIDYNEDGVVNGRDMLAWQRNPSKKIVEKIASTTLKLYSVYSEPLSYKGVSSDPLDRELLLKKISELKLNEELKTYDFTGMSVATYKTNTKSLSSSLPVTMLTPHYGVASNHNGPILKSEVFFRAKDGTVHSGIVSATLAIGEIRVIKFASPIDAAINRYTIALNPNNIERSAWRFSQQLIMQECRVKKEFHISETALAWIPYVTTKFAGSGRPLFVPLNTGELVLLGNSWTTGSTTKPSKFLKEINAFMASSKESVLTKNIPN